MKRFNINPEIKVSPEDLDLLHSYGWHVNKSWGYVLRAAKTSEETWTTERLHRDIARRMGWCLSEGLEVDHINRNKLDNRRENLRLVTPEQNARNKTKSKNNTSGYKGVSLNRGRWMVTIRVDKKNKNLGRYDDILIAAKVYDNAARTYFGEFAVLNFPHEYQVTQRST